MIKDEFSDLNRNRMILLNEKIKNSLLDFEEDRRKQWTSLNLEKPLLEALFNLVNKELTEN